VLGRAVGADEAAAEEDDEEDEDEDEEDESTAAAVGARGSTGRVDKNCEVGAWIERTSQCVAR